MWANTCGRGSFVGLALVVVHCLVPTTKMELIMCGYSLFTYLNEMADCVNDRELCWEGMKGEKEWAFFQVRWMLNQCLPSIYLVDERNVLK